ncbi:MAG: UDP-N-acetylmuramate--L-alanine ligase [Candidatus Omnitrophota bacterium]|jgi:UDP-N-acetylmuramate--alanine ligase
MNNQYHFVGIGGIGMSGIAQLMLRSGIEVSGSDLKESRATAELRQLGAKIYIGHAAENINGAKLVVYSSAVKEDNPEIAEARKRGIALMRRAEALAVLMQDKTVITVAGSHGKTTTTSLVSYLLIKARLSPTVAIGGILKNIDNNACLGRGRYFVAEADESDGSFLNYNPVYSIVTNIDHEHLDYYVNFDNEISAFRDFINKTDKEGCLFACFDDENLEKIMNDYKGRKVSFGLNPSADIHARDIKLYGLNSEFNCIYKGKDLGRFILSLGGRHNISNALSVIALGLELGESLSFIKKTLEHYKGAGRRLEVKFNSKGVMVIDDYAHHPTEIQATLSAAKNLKHKRLICAFQPHRYTRTKLLLDEFAPSFNDADYIIITDIYPASELPIAGIEGETLYDKIKDCYADKEVVFLPKEKIKDYVLGELRDGDIFLTLGAGDIVKVNDELVEELKRKS